MQLKQKRNAQLKALLVQLPLVHANFEIKEKFIPLSLCYLASQLFVKRQNIDVEIIYYPEATLSDNVLLENIVQKKPDVVGISCYVWNFDRTIYFANQLKKYLPNSKIILGGPEISRDNPLIFNPAVDVLVFGEGEEAIIELTDCFTEGKPLDSVTGIAYKSNGKFLFTKQRTNDENLDNVVSPYSSEVLNILGEINYAFIESRRGCPYRCTYCFYGKGIKDMRSFSIARVADEFSAIKQLRTIHTLYFIDSCINTNPDFKEVMTMIAKLNICPKINIQIEARAELIDNEQVELMKKANVSSVEIGLQSYNRAALKEIKRVTNFNRFERGVRLLIDNGIHVIIGSIHGLPHDNIGSIKKTVDYVGKNFVEADNHFYPLCVLPSTDIRKNAKKWKIDYQKNPPYLILDNSFLSHEQLHEAFEYSKKAITDVLESLPLFIFYSGTSNLNLSKMDFSEIQKLPVISRLYFEETDVTRKLINLLASDKIKLNLANSLVIYFKTENSHNNNFITDINKLLVKLYRQNPYLILNLILEIPSLVEADIFRLLQGISRTRGFIDHMNLYQEYVPRSKTGSGSVNSSLRILKIAPGQKFLNSFIRPVSRIYFDDILLDSKDFWLEEQAKGFLVDEDMNEKVPGRQFFEDLRKEIEPDKIACFKNLIAQKVWDEVINRGVTNLPLGESALMATKDGLLTAYFDRSEIMLDAAEWILANR